MKSYLLLALLVLLMACNAFESKPEFKSVNTLAVPLLQAAKGDIITWSSYDGSRLSGYIKAAGFDEVNGKTFKYTANSEKKIVKFPYKFVSLQVEDVNIPKNENDSSGLGLGVDLNANNVAMDIKLIFIGLENGNGEYKNEDLIEEIIGKNFVSFNCRSNDEAVIHANISKHGEAFFLITSSLNPKVASVNILPPNSYYWDKEVFKNQELKKSLSLDVIKTLFNYTTEECAIIDN